MEIYAVKAVKPYITAGPHGCGTGAFFQQGHFPEFIPWPKDVQGDFFTALAAFENPRPPFDKNVEGITGISFANDNVPKGVGDFLTGLRDALPRLGRKKLQ